MQEEPKRHRTQTEIKIKHLYWYPTFPVGTKFQRRISGVQKCKMQNSPGTELEACLVSVNQIFNSSSTNEMMLTELVAYVICTGVITAPLNTPTLLITDSLVYIQRNNTTSPNCNCSPVTLPLIPIRWKTFDSRMIYIPSPENYGISHTLAVLLSVCH